MKILLLEPFFAGSHRSWATGYQQYSRHQIKLLTLKGRHWKWRMFGGAVSLSGQFLANGERPDLILASDMLDLATFLALARQKLRDTPVAVYFHENQITYPWSPADRDVSLERNHQYGFINYTSALVADAVFFNSGYHRRSFLGALPDFLKQFPDSRELQNTGRIEAKSMVLPLGLSLKAFDPFRKNPQHDLPVILWNHRWEYDKSPELFFSSLFRLKTEGHRFKLLVLGQHYGQAPPIFAEARNTLKKEILHFGYVPDFPSYANFLWQADILPVTSHQDFFGGSVVEAIYCRCLPILPSRLAYLEHIPETLHSQVFYPGTPAVTAAQSDAAFYESLRASILNFRHPKLLGKLQNFVAQYDWSTLASRYDDALAQVVKTFATKGL